MSSASPPLTGRFLLRLTNSGNLIGEFSNNTSNGPQTESADRIAPPSSDAGKATFVGEYRSTWREETTAMFALLAISAKPHTDNIFKVLWSEDETRTPLFEGEAMLCEGMLIGNYWRSEPANG